MKTGKYSVRDIEKMTKEQAEHREEVSAGQFGEQEDVWGARQPSLPKWNLLWEMN